MIILASTSPARQSMLRQAGLAFSIDAPQVNERQFASLHPHWSPSDMAVELAAAKALDVAQRHHDATVIGADQVLALADRSFSKPRDRAECREHLRALRGTSHLLISGIAVAKDAQVIWRHHEVARLTMRSFSDAFLESYLDRIGEDCSSSVGGYKIEGPGIQLFERVEGDHFTILGLPLLALLARLRELGEIAT